MLVPEFREYEGDKKRALEFMSPTISIEAGRGNKVDSESAWAIQTDPPSPSQTVLTRIYESTLVPAFRRMNMLFWLWWHSYSWGDLKSHKNTRRRVGKAKNIEKVEMWK